MGHRIQYFFTLFVVFSFVFSSCQSKKMSNEVVTKEKSVAIKLSGENESLELLKMRCYACHQVNSISHDEIIAPPLAAVKRRYLRSFPQRDDFVEAIVNWTLDPKEEKAMMYGAVKRFKVMPYQSFDKSEMLKIAGYIYDNDLEEPKWFEAHEAEMHRNNPEN
jgi:hypothetical protein